MPEVKPGDIFGDLTVQTTGSKMQRVFCLCRVCQCQCRIMVYCLVNGKKRRCDKCEQFRDTTWQAPEKWVSPKLDPRNVEILQARKLRSEGKRVKEN